MGNQITNDSRNIQINANPPASQPVTATTREQSFSARATVFILENRTWRVKLEGIVEFVVDLNTYVLRLITSPGTTDETDLRLRPRIRSKGPRAYVVRAQTPNNGDDWILAVRFETDQESIDFRQFVERRDTTGQNESFTNVNIPPGTVSPINIVLPLKHALVVSLVINKTGIKKNTSNNEKVLNFLSKKFNFSILTKLSNNDTYYTFSPMTNMSKKKKKNDIKIEWTWKEIFDFSQETQKYLIDGKHDGLIFLVSCDACTYDDIKMNKHDDSAHIGHYDNRIDFGVLDSKSKVMYCNTFINEFTPQTDIPGIFIMDLTRSKENNGMEDDCIGNTSIHMNNNLNTFILRTQFLQYYIFNPKSEKEDLMTKVNSALEQTLTYDESRLMSVASLNWCHVESFFRKLTYSISTSIVLGAQYVNTIVFELDCMVITNLSQHTTIYVAVENEKSLLKNDDDKKQDVDFVMIKPKSVHNFVRETTSPISWITLYTKSKKNKIFVNKKFRENYLYYKDGKLNSILDLKPQCPANDVHEKLSKINFDLKRIKLNESSVKYQKYQCSGSCRAKSKKGGYYYYCQHCKTVCYCEQCYHKNILQNNQLSS